MRLADARGDDLQGAAGVGAQGRLDGHVEVARTLELVRERERTHVDRAQPAVGGELCHDALGLVVVTGDEHVQRRPGDRALDQRAGERRVERLDHLRAGNGAGDLLRDRARLDVQRRVGVRVDRVGDVDDDLAVELVAVASEHVRHRLVPDREHDDVTVERVAGPARDDIAGEL